MAADEYLVFWAQMCDVFDFDATVELDIGEDRTTWKPW